MTDLTALKAANAKRWADAKLTRGPEFVPVAKRLAAPAAKARYQEIEKTTGVPWFVVAVIHQRESSQDWTAQLGQGDPLGKVSTHVPKGMGPYYNHSYDPPLQDAFYRAAVEALTSLPPYAARNKDWSAGGAMMLLEQYNGLGYFNRGKPSPYIWSGTDQYVSGKYVADGVYDANAVDKQLGCAGLIMAMMAIDPTITFGGQIPAAQVPVVGVQRPLVAAAKPGATPVPAPAKPGFWASVASILTRKV